MLRAYIIDMFVCRMTNCATKKEREKEEEDEVEKKTEYPIDERRMSLRNLRLRQDCVKMNVCQL
jgi:hypothetical protein